MQCFCTMISSYLQFISISATRSLVKFSKPQLYYMLRITMTECSLLTHPFVWSFFLSPVRSLSIFFSSLTRSFVLGSFFHYLVRSFVPSPVRSFLRSCARCLFSYSLVRARFIRLFSHPFARSRGRTFVVFFLTRSFLLGWFVCSLTRFLVLTVVRSLSLILLVRSCSVRSPLSFLGLFVWSFVLSPVCSFLRSCVCCLFSYSFFRA